MGLICPVDVQTKIPCNEQKLLFSGRVMKNDELLSAYKIFKSRSIPTILLHTTKEHATLAPFTTLKAQWHSAYFGTKEVEKHEEKEEKEEETVAITKIKNQFKAKQQRLEELYKKMNEAKTATTVSTVAAVLSTVVAVPLIASGIFAPLGLAAIAIPGATTGVAVNRIAVTQTEIHAIQKQLRALNDQLMCEKEKKCLEKDEYKGWDQNLLCGIGAATASNEQSLFNNIIHEFDESVLNLTESHQSFRKKIKGNIKDKSFIRKQLLLEQRCKIGQIDRECQLQMQELKGHYKNKNVERMMVQQIVYDCEGKAQKIGKLFEYKLKTLSEATDVTKWLERMFEIDHENIKKDAERSMVRTQIAKAAEEIKYAKYLANSPFADDLRKNALKTDHSITEIARLAETTLVVDMIDRNICLKPNATKYLQFQLRLDDEYSNWNDKMKSDIQNQLIKQLGIRKTGLRFVSARNGCIAINFRVELDQLKVAMGRSQCNVRQDVNAWGQRMYNKSLDPIIAKMKTLIEDKGPGDFNENALYGSYKCVALIVTHEDRPGNVLDDDFLSDEVDRTVYNTVMNPRWDREYGQGQGKTNWKGPLNDGRDRGDYPYFCPSGWKRYAIRVPEFDSKTAGWSVCYHGMNNEHAAGVLSHGIIGSRGVGSRGGKTSYFSPSIEYSAHPRYAQPLKMKNSNKFIQTVFQCRINTKASIFQTQSETLRVRDKCVIDPNFTHHSLKEEHKRNKIMEFLLHNNGYDESGEPQYYCYGIMMRICDSKDELKNLPSSHWWKHSGGVNNNNWENQ
eukprot:39353_1